MNDETMSAFEIEMLEKMDKLIEAVQTLTEETQKAHSPELRSANETLKMSSRYFGGSPQLGLTFDESKRYFPMGT